MRFHRAILAFLVALPFGSAIASGACGCELLGGYLQIGGALCSDNLSEVKVAAAKLLKDAEFDNIDAIIAGARAISEAKDLTVARNAFRVLSEEVIPLAEGDSDYVLLTCSMAHGGDWVQSRGEVRNPYFGKAMLNCGAPKKVK